MHFVRIILRIIGYAMLSLLVAIAWLSLLRADLELQYAAQAIVELIGPPVLVALLIGAFLTWRRWRKRGGRVNLAVFTLAVSGALACTFTISGYVAVAWSHGLAVNPLRALWPSLPVHPDAGGQAFVYDRYEGEPAKLFVYRPQTERNGPRPILVYVHGGGWVQGENRQRERDLRWFADQGYLVVGIDYALSSPTRHLWDITQPQIACALSWIERNGGRFGGDPSRIAMFGESAGGNLVINVANLVNAGRLASRCGGQVPTIDAVVSIYPPIEMAALAAHPPATRFPLAYVGGMPAEFPERYAAVSPSKTLARTNPRTLILTGLDDSLVPAEDTLRHVERARAVGVTIDLITLPRAGHGFDMLPGSIGNQIVRSATLRFLATHGLAP